MKGLYAAVVAVQAQAPKIVKDKTARVKTDKTNYTYAYADLADISEAVMPLLAAQGLAWITRPTVLDIGTDQARFALAYLLAHTSGEILEGEYPLPDPNRVSPQSVGSAITYGRRYALCAVLGLAPDADDDDAARAQERWQQQEDRRQADQRQEQGLRSRARKAPAAAAPPDDRGERAGHKATPQESRQAHAAQQPPASPDQVRLAMTLAGKLGINGAEHREARLARASEIAGRPVDSFNSLTGAEISRVIDAMQAKVDEQAGQEAP